MLQNRAGLALHTNESGRWRDAVTQIQRDESEEAPLPTLHLTPSFPFFLTSAAGLSSRLAERVLLSASTKGFSFPGFPCLRKEEGRQVAADSQVVRHGLGNGTGCF